MLDIIWPEDLVPFAQDFYLQPHVGRSESPFNRQRKLYALSADRWRCRMSFRGGHKGTHGQAAYGPRLDALIDRMKGGVRRVGLHDFRRPELRGDVDAADLTADAAAAGASWIMVRSAEAAGTILARAGDYLGGDGRPHRISRDAIANADGDALVHFNPPLARALLAGQAVLGQGRGFFRLASEDAGSSEVEIGEAAVYTLELVEDWLSVEQALAFPPFATFDCSAAVPDASDKFRGVRLDTNFLLFRQYIDETGFTEEYVYHRIHGDDEYPTEGGAIPVNDGLQLVSKRTYAFGRVFEELLQPLAQGLRTITEFAARFGYTTDDYATIAANVNAFGHGRMICDGCVLQLDGAGADLIEPAAWPVGIDEMLTGDGIVATSDFKLLMPDDVEGVQLIFTQDIGATFGLRESGFFEALVANVAFQDSPLAMMAWNFGEDSPVDTVKLNGEAVTVTPNGDTLLFSPWGATTAEYYQGYHSVEPSVVFTLHAAKKVIQDYPGETLDPYEFCESIRVGVVNQTDFVKVLGYGQSTDAGPIEGRVPTPLPNDGTVYFFDNRRRTHFRPDGAI